MIRSLFMRRLVTGISIVMLLLCQTAAAAFTYTVAVWHPAPSAELDATTPCPHDVTAADDNTPVHGCQDRCPSRDASFKTAKVNIPAVDSLALKVLTVDVPDPATTGTARHEKIHASATPPPLILVYCRLLI